MFIYINKKTKNIKATNLARQVHQFTQVMKHKSKKRHKIYQVKCMPMLSKII